MNRFFSVPGVFGGLMILATSGQAATTVAVEQFNVDNDGNLLDAGGAEVVEPQVLLSLGVPVAVDLFSYTHETRADLLANQQVVPGPPSLPLLVSALTGLMAARYRRSHRSLRRGQPIEV